MAFWSQVGTEPLRQHRWYMTFGGSGNLDAVGFALKKVDRPKAKIGSVQHKYLNHFFNYPGRLEWEDINVTFASITDPSASKTMWNILTAAGYGVPESQGVTTGDRQNSTIGKNKFNEAIGNSITLNQINADGLTIESWKIYRPLFTSVQFGALDYGSEEIVEITCTMKYDWAQLESFNAAGSEPSSGVNPGFPSK